MNNPEIDLRYGRDPARRYYGKYPGIVTDNGPPSDGGAHRGQVKVQVPGILEETADAQSQQPIEVVAAPAFLPGFFFVPDNQDPVWVEFVAGDINFPIWTGVWYPDDAAPTTTDPTTPKQSGGAPTLDQKVIRTKSGQVVQLDDTDGSEKLVISDEKNGNLITLDDQGIHITASPSGGSVTLTFGETTVVVEDESITLTQGESGVKLDGSGVTITDSTNTGTFAGAVLSPFYQWFTNTFLLWAQTHMHTGNLGAPTSPPVVPPLPPPPPLDQQSLSAPPS